MLQESFSSNIHRFVNDSYLIISWTYFNNSLPEKGFVMYPSAPNLFPFWISSAKLLTVKSTTKMCLKRSSSFTWRKTSIPDFPGIITSKSIKEISLYCSSITFIASFALALVSVPKFPNFKNFSVKLTIFILRAQIGLGTGSSSTISIVLRLVDILI